jgi:predicted permease
MLRSFLRAALGRRAFERDLDAELRFHLAARADDLVRRGADRPQAERQARLELGDPVRWKEQSREAQGLALVDQAIADARYGYRSLFRQPAFAAAAISTLALAIASSTTMFAMADAVIFKPLPFEDAARLVWIMSVRTDRPDAPFTLPEYLDYRERNRTLTGLAAYANWSASVASEGLTERLQGARVSANAFAVLGVTPAAGRLFTDADDRADAPAVVVISHRLWQQRFGGAADVVGRQLRVNGLPVSVAGVLPRHFPLPLPGIDMFTPLSPDRDPLRHVRSSTSFLRFFGRLAPGVGAVEAQQDLTAICVRLREEFPNDYVGKVAAGVTPLTNAIVGDLRATIVVLFVAVVVVLAACIANLLGLMLVRTNDRGSEIAIRVAIGASQHRLTRQLAVEALALTTAAGAAGCVLAALAVSTATSWAPSSIPRLGEVRLDGRAMLFAGALTLGATVLLTLAPLGALVRTRAHHALRLASRGSTGDRWNHRIRHGLVVAEISAAVVLLLATSLVGREFARLQRVSPGFTPDQVFQARVSLPQTYRSPADLARFHEAMLVQLTAMPGVRAAGLISSAPLSGVLASVPFSVVGADQAPQPGRLPGSTFRVITPGYLAAAGTRVLRGRGISDDDRATTQHVALVSEALADRYLGATPLGRQLMIDDNNTGPRPVEVVGIVENVRHTSMEGAPGLDVYIPLSQSHPDGVTFVRTNQFWMIRSDHGPAGLDTNFVKALQAVDRDAAVSGMGTLRQGLEAWFAPRRFSLLVFVVFALTTALLAVSGVYGLVSYAVGQRRRELALRMALGASVADVRGLVLRQVAGLGVGGIVAGVLVAMLARPLTRWLVGDAAIDLALSVAIAGGVLMIVLLAGALPARRAGRIAPAVALKSD